MLPFLTRSSQQDSSWHTVSQSRWWLHPIFNSHKSRMISLHFRKLLQQPDQTWMPLNPVMLEELN
jgi:hypothetical protein